MFPELLQVRLKQIFSPEEVSSLKEVFHLTKRQTSLRVNTLKASAKKIESELAENNITYTKLYFPENCYLLEESFAKSDLWKLNIYKKGEIYVQGISSQIPPLLFKSPDSLKSGLQLRILDACAAPGGKTSQLAALYPDAEIWAFESSKIRFEKLKHNLEKLGILMKPHTILSSRRNETSVICINDSIENIQKYVLPSSPGGEEIQRGGFVGKEIQSGGFECFDMILVDAPCSGEGALSYHNTKLLKNWDISHIKKNYARQKAICDAVLPYLKVGGEMIYSTCTLAPEENEAVIHYVLCKYPDISLEKLDFTENKYIKHRRALKSFGKYIFRKEVSERSLRVIPSKYSEGFYIAKLRRGAK